MPIDICTPLLFIIAFVSIPILVAIRSNAKVLLIVAGLESAIALLFWFTYISRVNVSTNLGFISLLAAIYALPLLAGAWILIAKSRNSHSGDQICRQCGYDLRATPHRCPECGAIPKK